MSYIDKNLFRNLKQTTLKCGRNISGYIYMNYFDNKEKMTNAEFLNLRRDFTQELQINRTVRCENLYDKYNKSSIDVLKRLLNL